MIIGLVTLAATLLFPGWLGGKKEEPQCPSLEMKHLVTMLSETDVFHQAITPMDDGSGKAWHLFANTNMPEKGNPRILINSVYKDPIRRLAVIHEFFHLRQFQEEGTQDEGFIRACSIRKYKEVFGGDLDLPETMREGGSFNWRPN